VEPPIGIEPMTYALRAHSDAPRTRAILEVTRSNALDASRPLLTYLGRLRTWCGLTPPRRIVSTNSSWRRSQVEARDYIWEMLFSVSDPDVALIAELAGRYGLYFGQPGWLPESSRKKFSKPAGLITSIIGAKSP
jgi:hypothetical protein